MFGKARASLFPAASYFASMVTMPLPWSEKPATYTNGPPAVILSTAMLLVKSAAPPSKRAPPTAVLKPPEKELMLPPAPGSAIRAKAWSSDLEPKRAMAEPLSSLL